MADDSLSISDWLDQGTAEPGEAGVRYDAWAATYDADLESWSYRAPSVVAETVVVRRPGARSVLDVGCGTGLAGRALRAEGYAGELHGLDISEASLDVARGSGLYTSVRRADLQQRLPLADDSVDAAVCVGVMTYLPDVEAVWRELARVVRPGGLVVLTQREDLWEERGCPEVLERLSAEGVWTVEDLTGPAPYLPLGYGGGGPVACYYLAAAIRT